MEFLINNIVVGVKPQGSEALPFEPKNHSNIGEGMLECRGIGSRKVTEHVSE